jgi:small-conductance mechanosensitive channel
MMPTALRLETMDRRFRFSVVLRSATLAVALVVAWPSAVLARPLLASAIAADRNGQAVGAVTVPLADQLSEARLQLQQAIQARSAAGKRGAGNQLQPMLADKQRLLDWLADLQQEKVKRLEELATLPAMAKSPADADPLVKGLQGPPPYSAIQVDALRDEIDGLQEKLAAAEASHRANQTELQNLNAQLKARAAVARRTGTPSLGSQTPAEKEKAQGERDIASLLERIAEVEIAVTALDQQRLTAQIAALRDRVEDMQAVVASVLPRQQLSQEDLGAEHQRLRREEDRLGEEIERVGRRTARHRSERDKLAGAGDASSQQAAFLDLAIKTDNAILKGLDHLQMINGVSGDAWDRRYLLLSGTDPQQRRAALNALTELRQKLADWCSLSRTRQDALRTEIRAQRIRVDNLSANRGEPGRETELLNLLLQQTAMDERTELAARRLERQVSRWLDDLAAASDRQIEGRLAWLADAATRLATRIWQQELFVAEDVSEVDGRRVSVQYGVTVGKSLGIVVVFVLGYWLLARFSRLVQRQLVARLKLSPQIASMLRRWAMIVLSVALVVLILNLARIPLSVFAFAGGALAIGIGFGAQTIIKNFISGLILLFERKIRVGDIVELGGVKGRVAAVDLRATTVRGDDGQEAVIPNANFVENQVVNWTYSNQRVRRELKVGVAYGTDLRRAEVLFLAAATSHANVLRDPAPEVFFEDFGDSTLTVVLVYWVELDSPVGPRRVASDLRHDICRRLATAGIAIPFPQHEVHVNFAEPVAVRNTNERNWRTANAT